MSTRSRLGDVVQDHCPTCTARSVDAMHVAKCALDAAMRDEVVRVAEHYEVPPTFAVDLFAHMRSNPGADAEGAMRRAVRVMELGWRPGVGQ